MGKGRAVCRLRELPRQPPCPGPEGRCGRGSPRGAGVSRAQGSAWRVLTARGWSVAGSWGAGVMRPSGADRRLQAQEPGQWGGTKGDSLTPHGYLGCLPPYRMEGSPLALWGGSGAGSVGAAPAGEGGPTGWAGRCGPVWLSGACPGDPQLWGTPPRSLGPGWLGWGGGVQIVALGGEGAGPTRLCAHKGRVQALLSPSWPQAPGPSDDVLGQPPPPGGQAAGPAPTLGHL